MSRVLYDVSNTVEAVYDRNINSIVVTWTHLGPHDHLRPCVKAQLECVKRDGAKALVVDTSNATGVLKQEDQEWFNTQLFPSLQAAGLKAIITVVPQNALTKLAARQWQSSGRKSGIEFIQTESRTTALERAKTYAL